ncbi:hypothetical protein CSB45_01680 [candidate division KSB3 bacterium]|uniref:Sulfatase N-terminal domain-containing protein n=1 Tax=candidate division KSB3 bacterium TaxID=2044937 RepID=A0A2G6EAL5_9BACT|nr:MAG: hypothetical protein CSB45_01680 [candidate division KSB3 bacterium]PIE30699.1 MAG: hypothetical protein CSA57_01670 [candidate division KSB3 bacterium]
MDRVREKAFIMAFSPYLLLWLIFCLIAIVGGVASSGVVHDERLPAIVKSALCCSEALLLFSVLTLYAGLRKTVALWLTCQGTIRRVLDGILLLALLMFYLLSWLSFYRLGIFFNITTLKMLFHDPVQLFRYVWHVDSAGVFQLFFISLVMAGAASGLLFLLRRAPFILTKRCFICAFLLLLAALLVIPAGSIYTFIHGDRVLHDDQNVAYSLQEHYTVISRKKTGPFLTLTKDLLNNIFDKERHSDGAGKFTVARSPIISMEDYQKTIDMQSLSGYNVIILLIESMRKDVLPVYQGKRNVMPTVEWIASQSLVFEQAYSQATHSNYADIPPLSSHYPLRSRYIHFYPKNPPYPRVLFYDILKPLGYQTSIFSSQNEEWGGMINYLSTPGLDTLFYSELSGTGKKSPWAQEGDRYAEKMFSGEKISGELDDRVTIDAALAWLKTRDKNSPFAMYVNLQNSHYPYEVPLNFQRRFLTGPTQELEARLRAGDIRNLPLSIMYDHYCDSLAYMDEQIARLVSYLQEEQEWEKTILVVSADTATRFVDSPGSRLGFMIGNGGAIVDEVVNVPLLICAPQLSHKRDSRCVQHIDILPTIIGLLGLPQHPSFQGIDLMADDYPASRTVYIVSQTPFAHQYALIQDQWQLLYDKEKERYFFIDLTTADEESVRPYDERLVEDLQMRLHAWIELQIEYYDNHYLHSKFYPPVIMDE